MILNALTETVVEKTGRVQDFYAILILIHAKNRTWCCHMTSKSVYYCKAIKMKVHNTQDTRIYEVLESTLKFRTVSKIQNYILQLPEDKLSKVLELREILISSYPQIEETMK